MEDPKKLSLRQNCAGHFQFTGKEGETGFAPGLYFADGPEHLEMEEAHETKRTIFNPIDQNANRATAANRRILNTKNPISQHQQPAYSTRQSLRLLEKNDPTLQQRRTIVAKEQNDEHNENDSKLFFNKDRVHSVKKVIDDIERVKVARDDYIIRGKQIAIETAFNTDKLLQDLHPANHHYQANQNVKTTTNHNIRHLNNGAVELLDPRNNQTSSNFSEIQNMNNNEISQIEFFHDSITTGWSEDSKIDVADLNKFFNTNIQNIDLDDHGVFPQYNIYVNHVYKYLYSLEKSQQLPKNFIKHQTSINERMRCILVDWMLQVQNRFRMVPETIELAVKILDKYLHLEQVGKDKLQLVGIVCLLVAAKYEETYHPEVMDLVRITSNAFNTEEIVAMERSVLNAIGFDLSFPIPINFLRRFSKAVGATNRTHKMAKFFLELALLDCKLSNCLPSILAAASLYLATILLAECEWNDTSIFYSMYSQKELLPYARLIASHVYKVSKSAMRTTIKKYSGEHFDCLSEHSCFKSQTFKSLLPVSLKTT